MKRNLVIGISGSLLLETDPVALGNRRVVLSENYIKSVTDQGAIVVVLPVTENMEIAQGHIDLVDGLILSGGMDVNPLLYDEEPHYLLNEISNDRDRYEFLLLQAAKDKGIPILGICRGCQLINVYHGGTLYQDQTLKAEAYIKHNQGHSQHLATHTAIIEPNSLLAELYGEAIPVNSFHHQSIYKVAPNFRVTATAPDGIVEAIESVFEPPIVGIQWHPEMMAATNFEMSKLFSWFVRICSKNSGHAVNNSIRMSEPSLQEGYLLKQFFEKVMKDLYRREGILETFKEELLSELREKRTALDQFHFGSEVLPYFLTAKKQDKLVGCIALTKPNDLIEVNLPLHMKAALSDYPEIASVFVNPDLQGRGIGSTMFEAIQNVLREQSFKGFCLDCGYPGSQGYWIKQLGQPNILLENQWGEGLHHMIWHFEF